MTVNKTENTGSTVHKSTLEEVAKATKKSIKKRKLQTAVKKALESNVYSDEVKKLFEDFGFENEKSDYVQAIACAIIKKAAKGDLSAVSFIREIIKENEVKGSKIKDSVVIVDDIKTK